MKQNTQLQNILIDFFIFDGSKAFYTKSSRREGSTSTIIKELIYNFGFSDATLFTPQYIRIKTLIELLTEHLKNLKIEFCIQKTNSITFLDKKIYFKTYDQLQNALVGISEKHKNIFLDAPHEFVPPLTNNYFIEYEILY